MLFVLIGVLAFGGYLTAGLACVGGGVAKAFRRRWGAVLPCAVIPATIAMFVAFPGTWKVTLNAADYIHFAAFSWQYEREVDAAPRTDGPRLLWFLWADLDAALYGETLVFLVFDESDEFALPDVQRSAAWQAHARSGFTKAIGYVGGPRMPDKPHHLFGHYYVVRVDY